MPFIFFKLAWLAFAPSHLLALNLLVLVACVLAGWWRAARWWASALLALLLLFAILPLNTWLARQLEDRYPRPAWPAHVDGMVVLGGGLSTGVLADRGVPAGDGSIMRLVAAAELARRYPQARLIFTGGSGLLRGGLPETTAAAHILTQMGVAPSRLTLESHARNTWENILFARRLANPRPGETWLLATSALHLPRAMATAQRQGWSMLPWPTDYVTSHQLGGLSFNIGANLAATDAAVHEWLGLAAYRGL